MKFLGAPSSGSVAGQTFSRNRNGQYVRNRRAPVQPRTAAQLNVRSRQSTNAASWRALTGTQQEGWTSLGLGMTRTDSLGSTYKLTGFQAYCSVNNILAQAGDTLLGDAPAQVTPTGLASMTLTIAHGTPAFSVAYTATPLATGTRLIIRASPQRSAGRTFEGDYRVILVTAAAAASPANILTAYEAKFGVPQAGRKIFVSASTTISGFESIPFAAAAIVAA